VRAVRRCGQPHRTAAPKLRDAIRRFGEFVSPPTAIAVPLCVAVLAVASVGSVSRAQSGALTGSCGVIIDDGKATITFSVENVSTESIFNVTPDTLGVTAIGTATLSILTEPKPVRELLGGSNTHFIWRGKVEGDGVIHLSTQVTADVGGTTDTTGPIACDPVTIGNPARLTPAPTRPTRRPTKSPAPPAGTPEPTRTLVPTNPPRQGSRSTPTASQAGQGTGCAIGPGASSDGCAVLALLSAMAVWWRRRNR